MKRPNRFARPRPRLPGPPPSVSERVLEIAEVGGRGDGVAAGPDGPIYAPFALPGESVRARIVGDRAELVAIERASAARATPPCAVFGLCGGCQLQHWAEAPYLAWKEAEVRQALARRGVSAPIAPITPAWGEGRRRAAFHAARVQGRVLFGFIERGGARIAPLETCPALAPALAAAMPALTQIAALLAPERGEITLHCLLTDTGVDCDVKGARRPERDAWSAAASAAAPLARLTLDGEPLALNRAPRLTMDGVVVAPPPGAFMQATAAGEAALARLVVNALSGAKRVADLFSGLGTFALRLAATAPVDAYDGEPALLAALKRAADEAGGLKAVTTARRDLLRTPLSALELKRYDAIVFDPPRSGARLQAAEIAKSKAQRVAAVACDAGTFARDARVLIDGGFVLETVFPVDQFRWTSHVEIVGVFTR